MPLTRDISPALQLAIDATKIRVERVENYPVAGVKKALQVRHDTTGEGEIKYNGAKVTEYKNKFEANSVPPPIGITRDGVLIWGNHRVAGAKAAGVLEIPALVFNVDGLSPSEHTRAQLTALSGRENAEHGLPLSNRDREIIIRQELVLGTSSGTIQATYGVTASSLSSLRREIDAEKRLGELGVAPLVVDKDRSTLRAFSGPNARNLTNGPFKELVKLAASAGLKAKDINELAATAKDTGTEEGALKVLADKREELKPQIAEILTGGYVRPSPLTRLRKAVTEVSGLCAAHEPSVYKDYTSDAAATKASIESAIECLQAILKAQEA